MFGIDKAKPDLVIRAVKDILGVDAFDGYIGMRWSLRHVISRKRLQN
jgi:hypothetical protein